MPNPVFEENVEKLLPSFQEMTNQQLIIGLGNLYDDLSDLSKLDTLYAILMYNIETRFTLAALIKESISRLKECK